MEFYYERARNILEITGDWWYLRMVQSKIVMFSLVKIW